MTMFKIILVERLGWMFMCSQGSENCFQRVLGHFLVLKLSDDGNRIAQSGAVHDFCRGEHGYDGQSYSDLFSFFEKNKLVEHILH